MAERGTCWSITINNPEPGDALWKQLPSGWQLEGQIEKGEKGTKHFQGMLITPKISFTTVKQYFPRAHIEKARKKVALQKYVHKSETRLAEFTQKNRIPTIFEFQEQVAGQMPTYNELCIEYKEYFQAEYEAGGDRRKNALDLNQSKYFMKILDEKTNELIEAGERGLEFIAINPMWRSSWMRFYKGILNRHLKYKDANNEGEGSESGEVEPSSAQDEDEGTREDEEDGDGQDSSESGQSTDSSDHESDTGSGGD